MTIYGLIVFISLLTTPEAITYEISEGRQDKIPESFQPLTKKNSLNTQNSYWVKVKMNVKNDNDFVLTGGEDYMQCMTFYAKDESKIGMGNKVELSLRQGMNIVYIFYPFLDLKEENRVSVELIASSDYYENELRDKTFKSLFSGIVFFLFLMSLAFYIAVKMADNIYLKYALYLFSVFYFFAYQFGFLGTIFPIVNSIHPTLIWISSASLSAGYVVFFQSFLNLKETDPLLNKVCNYGLGFVAFIVVCELSAFLIKYDIQNNIYFKAFSLFCQFILFSFIVYRLYRLKTTLSIIAFITVCILAITSLGAQLVSSLRLVAETNYLIMAGLGIEIFILNLGIGFRMLIIYKEKRNAQFKLIDQLKINEKIQEGNKVQLERTVERRTEELRVKNKQNELLLGEIHHRVKNNLQTIVSLLSIQQRKLKDEISITAIQDSKNRVMAMGLIHEHLYQNTSFAEIDFKNYVKELLDSLIRTYSTSEKEIEVNISIPSLKIEVDNGIYLGLIINELVNNSLKYAFEDVEEPLLEISIFESNDQIVLNVRDNGTKKIIAFGDSKTFGWKMVKAICHKIGGKLKIDNSQGLSVEVCFSADLVGLT